jgi:beta-phosphoglucomutase-like phosphatase (HAD superfamily)
MPLPFRCLLVDHDDTAVESTAAIHYPAHVESLRVLRPGRTPPTCDEWMLHNFRGVMEYLQGELALTPEELEQELVIWRSFTTTRVPPFFPGILPLLRDFQAAGGRVAVISHSEADVIAAHYRAGAEAAVTPDLVFGWDNDASRRKPSPWPVREALSAFACPPDAALVVDDLRPGILMARSAGVPFAAAGWGHRIPEIERLMRAESDHYCASVEELRRLILPRA